MDFFSTLKKKFEQESVPSSVRTYPEPEERKVALASIHPDLGKACESDGYHCKQLRTILYCAANRWRSDSPHPNPFVQATCEYTLISKDLSYWGAPYNINEMWKFEKSKGPGVRTRIMMEFGKTMDQLRLGVYQFEEQHGMVEPQDDCGC